MKKIDKMRKSLNYLVFRYNLETHLYMCEPWERKLVNTVFLAILSFILLVSYWYVPSMLVRLRNALPAPQFPQQWFEITSRKMQSDDM